MLSVDPKRLLFMIRVHIAKALIRATNFLKSLVVVLLPPQHLIEFNRKTYERKKEIESWGRKQLINDGLSETEKVIVKNLPVSSGKMLILGVGGGREAIPLAKMGFQVTGVDFVAGMIAKAQENARKEGVEIEGLVQEISELDIEEDFYDVIWLSTFMYSSIPSEKWRLRLLAKVREGLDTGGVFVCQFWYENINSRKGVERFRKVLAYLFLGNIHYQKGDRLWYDREFQHCFSNEAELRKEFTKLRFRIEKLVITPEIAQGFAILRV